MSQFQANMRGADFLQARINGIKRQFGPIALAAEVTEVKMAQVRRDNLLGGVRSALIGEVAVPAEDALLEAPGAMRTILEHFDIVVSFQQQDVCAAYPFEHEFCGMAEVCQNPNVAGAGLYQESNRVVGIMRHGKSLHEEIA